MGGSGSGRQGGYPTAEACQSFVIDIASLRRGGLRTGLKGEASLKYGEDEFPIRMAIDTTGDNPHIVLTHETRSTRYESEAVSYRVQLTWTQPPFGGRRWWFRCPKTYRRAQKLVLPLGGHQFWSRRGYGLGYPCQRETPYDRAMRRLRKLDRTLGGWGEGIPDDPPEKPKWMRWRTYESKQLQWQELEQRIDFVFIPQIARLF